MCVSGKVWVRLLMGRIYIDLFINFFKYKLGKMAHYYCISKKLTIYHCFENMKRYSTFFETRVCKIRVCCKKLSSKNLSSFKKYTQKNFENFLWYYEKFNIATLEYPKSDRFLHIFEIVIDGNIICKNVLFNYFHLNYLLFT